MTGTRVIGISLVMSVWAGNGWAADRQRPVEEHPPASAASAQQAQRAKAMAELNGSQWAVEFSPMSGEKLKKAMNDTLEFSKGKISAANMVSKGFAASNFSLTIGEDGMAVWETMQNSDTGDVAFWRGELHGQTMSGILSKHPAGGGAEDYSFQGQRVGTVAEPPASSTVEPVAAPVDESVPAQTVAPVQPAPVAAPAAAEPAPKKKKGWFGR